MDRRRFLTYGSLSAYLLLSGCGGSSAQISDANSASAQSAAPLPIPPLLEGQLRDGVRHFDLTLQKATHTFFEGIDTATYAVNGTYLGPTLKLQNAQKVSINYTNTLDESTTMHGHGMHVPAAMDGTPHQLILPNETWSATYTVTQQASTNWYHPHKMGVTAEHVYKGLAGLIYVEDETSAALDLPRTYGVDDIPLILQDRRFDGNGQLLYNPTMREIMHGFLGDTPLANGAIRPTLEVSASMIRLRILNGSNASVYRLRFSDNRTFYQIATDGGFIDTPIPLTSLRLSPAERAEILVDLSGMAGSNLALTEQRLGVMLNIAVTHTQPANNLTLPSTLVNLPAPDPSQALTTRTFYLEGRMGNLMINGKSMDMNVIDETVPVDTYEIWEVINTMGTDHNFHIHASYFRILDRNGDAAKVAPNEKGHKDTVYIPAGERVRFLVRMSDYADATTPYMYHCHFLEHEDAGMMGQFTVV